MIEEEWEDLQMKNSPRDVFICYSRCFQFNLDETSFLCNESELSIIGGNDKPRHKTICSNSRFSIIVLQVGSAASVNGPVIFMANGTKVHPRLRSKNLVTKYGFPEGSSVIPNKVANTDYKTWAKVVKVVAPGIRKVVVTNVDFFPSTIFSNYLTLQLCPSKLSADY